MDPSNWSSFVFQGHAQSPLQVRAELQSRFFASQDCAQTEATPPASPATIAVAVATAVLAPTSTVAVAPVACALEKKAKSKGPYICALCAKEFKNGYNLQRHEAIHTGAKAGRVPSGAMKMPTVVPLSLLSVPQLSGAGWGAREAGAGGGAAAVAAGGVVTTMASGKRIRKNHACEMCYEAFRDVYHLN
ncbi:Myc-associated zinc finger protein [Plecturocebus cupreus]